MSRDTLHAIAVHVLARRRFAVTGRFGLRACPGGLGTPAFGDPLEVLRVSAGTLIREQVNVGSFRPIDGATLRELAAFADADLDADFSCGSDTPAMPDPDLPLQLDGELATALGEWWALGWQAMDAVVAPLGAAAQVVQLWPEHFDAGTSVDVAGGINLGASPGDAFCAEPYLYVGPWGPERPGEPSFWNAPFGAIARRSETPGVDDARRFFERGIQIVSRR